MTSYNQDGKVGPWAQEKLKCLGDYLAAYTTILKEQQWCDGYYYIDAFAGAGKAKLRTGNKLKNSAEQLLLEISSYGSSDEDAATYINGSPYVALDLQHPFTQYIFIDKNPDRIEKLRNIKAEYAGRRHIDIVPEDAVAAIQKFLDDPSVNRTKYRAVVFLDPFGMQVPWSVIEALAQTHKIEIILNLPVGTAIQRKLPRSGEFTEEQNRNLDAYFGSSDWKDVIYEKTPNLFGDIDINKVDHSGERLAEWYRARLKEAFGFAPPPRLIRNSHGSHLYYLLFAGPNAIGAKIATDIFLKQGQRIKA